MTLRLLWDFFGPDARGTAIHHELHLREFFEREALACAGTGVGSAGEGHALSWCELRLEDEDAVTRALRPQRRVSPEHFDKVEWS